MKLIRWGAAGAEKPGLVDKAGVLRDLSGQHRRYYTRPIVGRGSGAPGGRSVSLPKVPEGSRLGVPLAFVPKIVCIGLNYADHAAEIRRCPSPRSRSCF